MGELDLLRILRIGILATLAMAAIMFGACSHVFAAEAVWESYTENNDTAVECYGVNWAAQSFTVGSEAHSVTAIRLLMYAEGSPSTVTVSVRATSDGDPTGADLCSGTIDGDTLTTDSGGSWYEIDVDDYSLEASTQYAIVLRAVAGDAANSIHWNIDGSSGAEANGQKETSTNGGVTWTGDSDDDFLFEVWGDNLIEIERAEVYRSYLEDDDMLIVVEYTNAYVPYYPNSDPSRYFDIQLRSTDGATVIASTVCKAWGNKPGAIYLSADSASSLSSGSAYRLYIYGSFTGTPSDYYTLTSSDWRGSDLNYLKSWCLSTAHAMESYYSTSLTTYTSNGEVLNEEGGVLFNIGIPELSEELPDLFLAATSTTDYEGEEWSNAFQGATNWEDRLGSTVVTAFEAGGDLLNLSGKNFGAMLLIIAYVAMSIAFVAKGHSVAGMIAAAPIFILGGWLGLISIMFILVVASILTIIIIYHFWWSRT